MPIKRCTLPSGKRGYKWGDKGKCYAERGDAESQASAAYAHGYTGKEDKQVPGSQPQVRRSVTGGIILEHDW